MKMTACIIFVAVLIAVSAVLPAAATTCLCVGYGSSKSCGNGAIGGSFLKVDTVSQNHLNYYLLTIALRSELASAGKAYDGKSGWFCWNGTLK